MAALGQKQTLGGAGAMSARGKNRTHAPKSYVGLMHFITWSSTPAVAERAGDEILSLPLSPAHSDDDIADAVAALRRVHERFTG